MSLLSNSDPRLEQAAATDESVLTAHEALLGKKPDDNAHYRLLPLGLLFGFSGLIFFAATYLNRYSGHFDPHIYNEHALPRQGDLVVAKIDPRELGKKLFNNATCNTCHQANGLGVPGVYPPLAGSEWVLGSEERAVRIVLYGLQGKLTVKGTEFPGTVPMPIFGQGVSNSGYNWSDDKIAAVLTYVRSEWGNAAAPITAGKVAEIHTKEGDHKPWTPDELQKLP
jgi:mono/diheme cytochrome c family protein